MTSLPAAPLRNPRFNALLAELKLLLAQRARSPKPRRKSFSSLDQPLAVERQIEPREVKLEYYSSLLDRKAEQPKCFSDDYLQYASSYGKVRAARRPSVTEPSTPTNSRGPVLPESELSETESQSSVLSDVTSPIKNPRRGSFSKCLEFHEPRTRRSKRAKVVRKTSASSTSSYDARPEPTARRMRKSASCHVKSKDTRREGRGEAKSSGDACHCALDALQRSLVPPTNTKSLPRNHKPHAAISRHLDDALRCEKDCLKILKAVSKETGPGCSPGPTYSRRGDSEESYFEGFSSSLPKRNNKSRYPKTAEIKKLQSVAATEPAQALVLPPSCFQTIEQWEKKRSSKPLDECVLRIENGALWIEICKAVQETEGRARSKVRPRD